MSIAERCVPLTCLGVGMASPNVGSVNLGDAVYFNPGPDVEHYSRQITECNIIPEFEVSGIGMINNILNLEDKIKFQKPMPFNIVLGHHSSTPTTVGVLIAPRGIIPHDTLWGAAHFDRRNLDIIAVAVAMSAGEVRIGYEDSCCLSTEEKAQHNY